MSASATQLTVGCVARDGLARALAVSTTDPSSPFVSVERAEGDRVKVAANEPAEYDELYRIHHGRVLRLCHLLLSDPDEAHDVTQDVFIKLFQAQKTEERTMVWA